MEIPPRRPPHVRMVIGVSPLLESLEDTQGNRKADEPARENRGIVRTAAIRYPPVKGEKKHLEANQDEKYAIQNIVKRLPQHVGIQSRLRRCAGRLSRATR